MMGAARHPRRWWRWAVAGYVLLLAVSHIIRHDRPDPMPAPPDYRTLSLQGPSRSVPPITVRYIDTHPNAGEQIPVVLVIHGSPAPASMVFQTVTASLAGAGRIIVPDLPGFGYSTRDIPDFGFDSHAAYLQALLDQLKLNRVHLVAYSMGGGAAIHLAAEHPDTIASVTLVSSIGVQELELLGDYHLNHAIHALQLAGLWSLAELTPHMGMLDRFVLNVAYARNFYDSDQRPLRQLLQRIQQPTFIIHGRDDSFVPPAAAREHARLVPQSRLSLIDGGHLLIFHRPEAVANLVQEFVRDTITGHLPTRATASQTRRAEANLPFGDIRLPAVSGLQLWVYALLIALATLVSEDLACIGAGMLAARGILGFGAAASAAFAGIFIGDLLLFAAGRTIGRPALHRPPVRWFVSAEDVDQARKWFNAKGPRIIVASRFLPGSRLPVYFAAGMLGRRLAPLLFLFAFAAAVWTPALVGVAMWTGESVLAFYPQFHRYALWAALGTFLGVWALVQLVTPLWSYHGRRLLLSRYKRLRHWEFWPIWAMYLPVSVYIIWIGIRHRCLTLFTAANPGMPAGGIVGESKSDILSQLTSSGQVAPFVRVNRTWPEARQLSAVERFLQDSDTAYPLVCKPDVGERGQNVQTVQNPDALVNYLGSAVEDTIVQRFIPGHEYGVFYYRYPGQSEGHILSITDKRLISVTGDGHTTLERLILADPRAVCKAALHLRVHRDRLHTVPAPGEKIRLVAVGTHALGALFLDGSHLITDAMTRGFDRVSGHFSGFYFGRYDVRTEDVAAFQRGDGFTILELNGVTSEATSIYDPSHSLISAWKMLMRQWRIAIDIGRKNVARGVRPWTVRQFLALVLFSPWGLFPHMRKKTPPDTLSDKDTWQPPGPGHTD